MKSLKDYIAEKLSAAVDVEKSQAIELLETPPSEDMGDFALPCYFLAKTLKKSPAAIATSLAARIPPDDVIDRIEAQGAYLNFFLNKRHVISRALSDILQAKENYGRSDIGTGKTIVIDYSSPNIAKPFGIGHLRSTVLGAALKRIYQCQGYDVVGVNHLGDWGTQFGKVILAYKLWGSEEKLKENAVGHLYELYVKIHQEEEADPQLAERTRQEFKKLENGDPENHALWEKFSELSRLEFEKFYKMLGVDFETVAGESFYNDMLKPTEDMFDRLGLLSVSRDATIIDLEKEGLPPLLIKKSDDTSLYATRDLAAAIYRKKTYNFHKMLYVVGVAQSLHFQQLFKALELMGFDWARDCHHVSFGWVKLGDEMMATRKGNIVLLEDVIAKTIELAGKIIRENSSDLPDPEKTAFEVGIGAVIFTDLAYRRDTDIAFDWKRMLDFTGNSGPYLQYTHARVCSVLRKYGKSVPSDFKPERLALQEEYLLVKLLSRYPDVIDKAGNEFEPYHISSFLLDLCGLFNTYYQKYRSPDDRIISSDPQKADSRIVLVEAVRSVLVSGLGILGLTAPMQM